MRRLLARLFNLTLLISFIVVLYCKTTYSPNATVVVYIPKGSCNDELATILSEKGVIKLPQVFSIIGKFCALSGNYLKFGEYEIKPKSTPFDIINLLISGDVIKHTITIPEGLSNHQVMTIVDGAYGLTGDLAGVSYDEGWLMPDTYHYTYPTPKVVILRHMHSAMHHFIAKLTIECPKELSGTEQLLTLASIVEKETAKPSERPMIAAVYLNRLRINMPLQADPTVIYAITDGKYNLGRSLLHADLLYKSPYNTYMNSGLPPSAIANPGKESILAVLKPADTKAIYFVANAEGGHNFAESYSQHLANVKLYRDFTNKGH